MGSKKGKKCYRLIFSSFENFIKSTDCTMNKMGPKWGKKCYRLIFSSFELNWVGLGAHFKISYSISVTIYKNRSFSWTIKNMGQNWKKIVSAHLWLKWAIWRAFSQFYSWYRLRYIKKDGFHEPLMIHWDCMSNVSVFRVVCSSNCPQRFTSSSPYTSIKIDLFMHDK